MITKANFFIIIILLLVGIIIIRQCTSNNITDKPTIKVDGKKYELLSQKKDTIIINHFKIKYVKGKNIYSETIIDKSIKTPLYSKDDTARIIQEYNKKILYKDTLILNNNLGTIEITDTIFQNKISGRKIQSQIKEITVIDTKIVKELPKNQIYAGVSGLIVNSNTLIGPQLILKTKKDNIYGLNIYVDNNLNRYIGISLAWKIKLKK